MVQERRFWNLERLWIIFLLIGSSIAFVTAEGYPDLSRRLPQLISAVTFVLSGYLLIMQLLTRQRDARGDATGNEQSVSPPRVISWVQMLGLAVGFILGTYLLGLDLAILGFGAISAVRLGLRWPFALVFGLVLAMIVRFCFGVLLGISLPQGWVFSLF